ncbi:MAG: biotin/lipoyl-binding protein [Ruminococcaceae bacterium]|nr:biotin/lipoyl-binding protein [Oscillospiraceae bacterium]
MRKFIVNVNGNSYEVEVEEVGGAQAAAPAQAPVQVAAPTQAPKAAPAAQAPAGGTPVKAPMPGNVLDIKVSNGQAVKEGDLVVILEAMKMENEIFAPCDGTVTVVASKGATVNTGDVLISLS